MQTPIAVKMENSLVVAATKKKVCNHLPNDIVLFILSKLPLISLKRFLCVSKSWSLLFKNTYFMNMLRNNILLNDDSYYDETFMVRYTPKYSERCNFYWLSDEGFANSVHLDWPSQFQEDYIHIFIVGSVSINGILCLKHGFTRTSQVVLWNPTTSETKVIPPSPIENRRPDRNPWHFLHGFGYDHVSDDYKVIQMIEYFPGYQGDMIWEDRSYDPSWEIYSLKTNSWKKLDIDMQNCYYYSPLQGNGLYADGVFHWWAISKLKNIEECMVSFDFSEEVMCTTLMPLNTDGGFDVGYVERHLVSLNESIALISKYKKESTFCISVLAKLGERESWINLFTVGPLLSMEYSNIVGMKNNTLFYRRDGELVCVDLKTQMIKELGVKGDRFHFHVGKYKKSFLPIRGIIN
ncbi:F-box protein CPR1-like [Trifolium pratense]|uniref:F-box protein CPR1-like n=1 Tax=Trifolium pratense TaxID=57577 RepID=UPI001E691537|nr:F-box protein CPR1-like [Trifolium pratense]